MGDFDPAMMQAMGGGGGMPGMGGGAGGMDMASMMQAMGGAGGMGGGAGGMDMAAMMEQMKGMGGMGGPDSDDEEEEAQVEPHTEEGLDDLDAPADADLKK